MFQPYSKTITIQNLVVIDDVLPKGVVTVADSISCLHLIDHKCECELLLVARWWSGGLSSDDHLDWLQLNSINESFKMFLISAVFN